MNNKSNNQARRFDKTLDNESRNAFNRFTRTTDNNRDKNSSTSDDLINSLQNKPENRRARQVIEWENTRRQTVNYL